MAALQDAEWAEWDAKRNRLVWVRDGVLYAAHLTKAGITPELQLYDFNPLRFERLEAPY